MVSKTKTLFGEVYGEWDESATPAVQPVSQQTGAERCELASSWEALSLGFCVVLNGKFTLANVSRPPVLWRALMYNVVKYTRPVESHLLFFCFYCTCVRLYGRNTPDNAFCTHC